jgi:RNA recognition motif-containing protein
MENEQHIPVPPVEPIEPQAAPQIEVPEVQVPGLSFTNSAAVDPLPIPDQSADPQVSYDSQPQNEYQPPDNEYHPTTTYDYQENATPEEYQRDEQSGDAGGSFHEEASREDGEARGLKRKHEEGSFDEDDNRQKRPRIEGSGDIKQTIFIGNLPPDVTESMLTEIFSSCGKIRDIRLNRHRDTGKVKGYVQYFLQFCNNFNPPCSFGFIEFEEPAYAEEALSKNGIEILGRRVNLELSNKSLINAQAAARWKDQQRQIPKERPPRSKLHNALISFDTKCFSSDVHAAQQTRPRDSTTVFIGNLDDRVNDDDIYRMFSHCGQIKEIRWLEDKQTGRFKG